MNDAQMVATLSTELQHLARAGDVAVNISPADAFALIGCLQLAWRHPRLSFKQQRLIENFVEQFKEVFTDSPVTRSVIEAGWTK